MGSIIIALACLLAGIAFLSHSYGIGATLPGQQGYQSVLSQMVAAVAGRGVFYYISIASILLVLCLSANTSFAGFPRVCRVLAMDEFLPAEFAHRGSRLVYSAGILVLTVLSGALLVVFGGVTDRLIPLFAVGAFLAFTLSQLGMVFHWCRSRGAHAKRSLVMNAVGAVVTGVTLVVIAVSKFEHGAWIALLAMPPLVWLFLRIRRYHDKLDREVAEHGPLDVSGALAPLVVIPMKRLDRVARKAIRLALTLSPEIHAVQILAEDMQAEDLRHCWRESVQRPAQAAGYSVPRLAVIVSPYREFFGPLLEHLRKLAGENPERTLAVMIPEVVERRWYQFFFRHRTTLLKGLLLMRGGPRIVIITTPWYTRATLKAADSAVAADAAAFSAPDKPK